MKRQRFAPSATAVWAVLLLRSATGHCQSAPEHDKVAAEVLFEDGRRLAASGNYVDACPKFADSEKLDPSASTLLNLANCLEKVGRTATAWATFKEAGSLASAAGRAEYVTTADRHANALFPKLARLVVNVPHAVDGTVVKRDGALLEHSEWGSAIPIDAGPHVLVATAPGYVSWVSTVEIAQDGLEVTVEVPRLTELPAQAAAPPVPTGSPTPAGTAPAAPRPLDTSASTEAARPKPSGDAQRIVAWTVGGAGVISLGVGAVFAATAIAKYHSSENEMGLGCGFGSNACEPSVVDERNASRTAGDVASWTLGLGAAAVVAGVAIGVTAPHGTGRRGAVGVVIAPTPGGALVQGSW
jgi:hypothetical protein